MMNLVARVVVSYVIGAVAGEIAVKGLKAVSHKIKDFKSEKVES